MVGIEYGMGACDLDFIEENMTAVLRPAFDALGEIAFDPVVVFQPGQERRQHRQRPVGLGHRAFGNGAVPHLNAIAGDCLRVILAEGWNDMAIDQPAIGQHRVWPSRQPDGRLPRLGQIGDPLRRADRDDFTGIGLQP